MDIKEVLKEITHTCKFFMESGQWSKNDAMRYAYIEIGKRISKSAKFFFSIEGKYGEFGLPVEEMEEIHFADEGEEVTCYVTAKMLKDVFKNLGIKSEIIQSNISRPYTRNGKTLDIYHSYLLAEGDDDKKYFMSPNMDLINIKYNFPIEHFGNAVPYIYNGEQTYQGEERDYSTLTPAELLEIDKKIGYAFPIENIYDGKTYYVYANKDRGHDEFGKQKIQSEQFLLDQLQNIDRGFLNGYTKLYNSFGNGEKTNFSDLKREEIRQLEWYVFSHCLDLVKENLDISEENAEEFLDIFNCEELELKAIQNQAKKYIVQNLNENNNAVLEDFQRNPFKIISTAINLLDYMERLSSKEYISNLSDIEKTKHGKAYRDLMKSVSKLFLKQHLIDGYTGKSEYPSNLFLMKKIKSSIEKDFECDTSFDTSYRPEFCRMGAVEQSAFLKQYLRSVLKPEFHTEQEFLERIMFSALSEKKDIDSNAYLIHIKGKDDKINEFMYSLLYNPKTNQINLTNFLELKLQYNILSKTVMQHISSMTL